MKINFPATPNVRVRETDVVSGVGQIPAQAALKIPVTIRWKPNRLGAFAIYLALDDGSGAGEQVVWGFAVTYPPAKGRKPDSPVVFNAASTSLPTIGPAYKRLGAKWVRVEIGWSSNEAERGRLRMGAERRVGEGRPRQRHVRHGCDGPRPCVGAAEGRGQVSNHLLGPNSRRPTSPASFCPQWQEWAQHFVERYKDTVRAGICLNEPWDGGSLSGWHGNGGHYREILRGLSLGAHAADPTFTILANDSSMNVEDNLMPAPGTMDLLDGVSVHTFRSYNAAFITEFESYGKRVWDTESWIGTGPSEMVHQLVTQLGQGFVKMQPMNSDHVYLGNPPSKIAMLTKKAAMAKKAALKGPAPGKAKAKPAPAPKAPQAAKASAAGGQEGRKSKKGHFRHALAGWFRAAPIYASPTGQAISVFLHFIEDTDFYREPRGESVPWMYVFKGRAGGPNREKNAATIQGHEHQWGNYPWYRVQSDGTLAIANPDAALTAYDVHGNPLSASGPTLQVPLTTAMYYVVSSKGADDLVARLRAASIRGLEPVQLALHDLTGPLAEHPPLRVTVTNAYNVPLSGKVEVKAPADWKFSSHSLSFTDLAPGASTQLSFAVTSAKAAAANRYPFTVTATTDKGTVKLSENLSSTVIVKGTPPLEGKADDWKKLGAVPVYLSGGKTAADSFLQYTMPFLNLQEENDQQYVVEFMRHVGR